MCNLVPVLVSLFSNKKQIRFTFSIVLALSLSRAGSQAKSVRGERNLWKTTIKKNKLYTKSVKNDRHKQRY